MKINFTILLILVLSLVSSLSFANDNIYIDSVEYGGSGCGEDEAWGVLSPDEKTLSVLFDNYIVEAGLGIQASSRKKCDLKINVKVPSNKVVLIKKIDYRLFALIPHRGRGLFKASYNMQVPALGYVSRTFKKQKTFAFEIEEDLLIEQPMVTALMKSKCGHDFSLDIKTEIRVKTNQYDDEAMLSIDSADGKIEYQLEVQDCHRSSGDTQSSSSHETAMQRRARLREEARNRAQRR